MTALEQIKELPEEVKVGRIIDSFTKFALGDIEYNITKPIATFILGSCFIDQMAAYRYNHGTSQNEYYYKEFIKEYLKEYNSFDLYNSLRCLLVHNYSLDGYLSLGSEIEIVDQKKDVLSANILTAWRFYNSLQRAFSDFCKDILILKSQARTNALNRFDLAPILVFSNYDVCVYSETDADHLINYCSKKIIGQVINKNSSLEIVEIKKTSIQPGVYKIDVLTKKKHRSVTHSDDLTEITRQLELDSPMDVFRGVRNSFCADLFALCSLHALTLI